MSDEIRIGGTRGCPQRPLETHFWGRVNKDAPGGCWLWTGRPASNGYGQLWALGQHWNAHTLSFFLAHGKRSVGHEFEIDHTCNVKLCVNPAHLELVPCAENKRRWFDRMKTCKRGHQRTPENTKGKRGKGRYCRLCALDRVRQYQADNYEKVRAAERARYHAKRKAANAAVA